MKRNRFIALLLAFFLLGVPLSGCTESAQTQDQETLHVVASFYPVYLIASAVAKDVPGVTVTNMAPQTTGCVHEYQLTMNDMKLLENAQLFLINGGGMEPFSDAVKDAFPDLTVCEATDGLEKIDNYDTAHTEGDAEHGDQNAHLWMSVDGACGMAEKISAAFAEKDPDHADAYQAGAKAFQEAARSLKEELTADFADIDAKNVEIFSEAFAYFAKDYGFTVVDAIALDEGEEPTAQELNDAITAVRDNGVRMLWTDSQYNDNTAVTVASETDAKVVTLSALTGHEEGDWCSLMRANARTLLDALKTAE